MDSIDVILDKRDLPEYKTVIEAVQKKYKVEFEHEVIKQTVYSNINSYIQVNEKGKIKRKGMYKYLPDEKPLGDSVNEHIIPKLLELYFIQKINPWIVLNNLEQYECNDIYLFTKSDKISKDYLVYHNGKVVQNLNRYYCSNKGAFLYKKKKETTRDFEHICKDSGVTLFNTYIEKNITEYDINLKYYYSKVMEIINSIHSLQLSMF